MKTIEELKAMDNEKLVAFADDLQNKLEKEKNDSSYWFGKYKEAEKRHVAMTSCIKNLILISEQS